MKYSVIIAAAGSSSRMGFDKLLVKINNEYVIKHSINSFIDDKDCRQIILVVKESNFDNFKKMFKFVNKLIVVKGSNTRFNSVKNGFKYVNQENVLIHDGARPYLSEELLNDVKNKIDDNDIVIPTINIVDSMVTYDNKHSYVPREKYFLVQTPQAFKKYILENMYKNYTNENFTDEGQAAIKNNKNAKIKFVNGEQKNKKITFESDLNNLFWDY